MRRIEASIDVHPLRPPRLPPIQTEPQTPQVVPSPQGRPDAPRYRDGLRAAAPLAVAILPFGVSFGVLARAAGFDAVASIVFSLTTFAGSAQFATVSVLGDGGTVLAAVGAALLLNARYLAIGFSAAGALAGGKLRRLLEAQVVVDETWALSNRGGGEFDRGVLLGAGFMLFAAWNVGTVIGVLAGDALGTPSRSASTPPSGGVPGAAGGAAALARRRCRRRGGPAIALGWSVHAPRLPSSPPCSAAWSDCGEVGRAERTWTAEDRVWRRTVAIKAAGPFWRTGVTRRANVLTASTTVRRPGRHATSARTSWSSTSGSHRRRRSHRPRTPSSWRCRGRGGDGAAAPDHLMMVWRHALAIVLLPGTVTIGVPALLLSGEDAELASWPGVVAGAALILAGVAMWLWTVRLLARIGKGTLAPWDPTRHLVVEGPYRHVRNPMISGVAAVLLGEALLFASAGVLTWFALVVVINPRTSSSPRSPASRSASATNTASHKRSVPRWVPHWAPRR